MPRRSFRHVVAMGRIRRRLDRFKTLDDDPIAEQARRQAWREEWDERRNGRLSARGDHTKQGNPLLRIHEGPAHWILEIALDELKPGKPDAKGPRYEKLEIPLYVARKGFSIVRGCDASAVGCRRLLYTLQRKASLSAIRSELPPRETFARIARSIPPSVFEHADHIRTSGLTAHRQCNTCHNHDRSQHKRDPHVLPQDSPPQRRAD